MTTKQDAHVEAAELAKKLRRVLITAQNDDLSPLASDKRTRHVERQEFVQDALSFIEALAAADRVTSRTNNGDEMRHQFGGPEPDNYPMQERIARDNRISPDTTATAAVEAAERALLGIAYMDVYTREGEKPPHEVMREIAMTAVTQLAAIRKGEKA